MPEFDIGLADGGELNFDKSFLQFNLKKKYMGKVILPKLSKFDWKCCIRDTAS